MRVGHHLHHRTQPPTQPLGIRGGGPRRTAAERHEYKITDNDYFEYKWEVEESLKPIPDSLLNYINNLSKVKPQCKIASKSKTATMEDLPLVLYQLQAKIADKI